MYWQKEYVREAVSMTLNDVYKLELPRNGHLGSILLRLSGGQASGYGQSGGDWRINDRITKLEVIGDGSDVIKSLTGYQAQLFTFLDQGVPPPDTWRNYATNTQFAYFLLNFGRRMKDQDMLLDMSKWNRVELQISNNATTSQFSDLTVSVLALWLREAEAKPPLGFMRSEEWRTWTTVANEWKYNELPTAERIRRVILQAIPNVDSDNVEQTNMANLMDDIELSLDTGKSRVYRGGIDDLMRLNYLEHGKELLVGGAPYQNADKGVRLDLGYALAGAWGAGSQDGAGAGTIATYETGRTSFTQKPETYEADSPVGVLFKGLAFMESVVLPWGKDDDPGTWLDPKARATVKLDIHTRDASSAASGTNKIILDRLAKY